MQVAPEGPSTIEYPLLHWYIIWRLFSIFLQQQKLVKASVIINTEKIFIKYSLELPKP